MSSKKRILWIDCAKFFAITMVILDHTRGILHESDILSNISFVSVTMFIFLADYSVIISNEKSQITWIKVWNRFLKLFMTYITASVIYSVFDNKGFKINEIVYSIFYFDASPPFYYFLIYFQLQLLAPLLVKCIKCCKTAKKSNLMFIVSIIFFVVLSEFLYKKMLIPIPIYGGAKYLFGCNYLLLYYLGMLVASIEIRKFSIKSSLVILLLSVCCWFGWSKVFVIEKFANQLFIFQLWGGGINPPNLSIIILALLTLMIIYISTEIALYFNSYYVVKAISFFANLGKNSLGIFIWHMLVLNLYLNIDFLAGINYHFHRFFLPLTLISVSIVFNRLNDCSIEILQKKFKGKIRSND